jgi:haloacetate dehalogenase
VVGVFDAKAEVDRLFSRLKVPVIDLAYKVEDARLIPVIVDNEGVASIAAEHLLSLGILQFAYCGVTGLPFSEERWKGFRDRLGHAGRISDRFLFPSLESVAHPSPADLRALSAWLSRRQRPVGVFAGADFIGQHVLRCCAELRLAVPQNVAVVSAGYEDIDHALSPVPQSHVLFATHEIGVRAAHLLRELVGGASRPVVPLRIAPLRLVEAQSTNLMSALDRNTERALRFIRAHYAESLSVTQIAEHAGLARRTLEKRFRAAFSRTPKEEIDRVRLSRIQELLVNTDDKLESIASKTGLQDAKHLSFFFSKRQGIAPGEYRRQSQHRFRPERPYGRGGGAYFKDFRQHSIKVANVTIECEVGGHGPPVLLLHGFPQDRLMWRRVAPQLAASFTVVCADLRGYGGSDAPPGGRRHEAYSKRAMAKDQVALMQALGFERFAVVGHDRGGCVAHRMALDFPAEIERLVLIDIVPTVAVFETAGHQLAQSYYHWFFLSQPFDLPERLIGADPGYYVLSCLERWSGSGVSPFGSAVLEHYRSLWQSPERIHSSCEDFRAAATIDLEHDQDHATKRIRCPVHLLWGLQSITNRLYHVVDAWRAKASGAVTGRSLPCGHFVPEECPDETVRELLEFLGRPVR